MPLEFPDRPGRTWEFDQEGYMRRREASINDLAITSGERRIFGPRQPHEHDQPLPLQQRTSMHVAALWRYPIKSLAGEPIEAAELTLDGIGGDRIVHVRGAHGPLTGRTRNGLLTVPASTGPDGVPRVAGHPWHTPAAHAIVQANGGDDAQLAAYDGPERFDILNLLVATDGAVQHFGHDIRRLRPNLLIAGVPADAERDWPGQALAIGDVLVGVHTQRQRCVVTSIDPDTGDKNPDVFRRIRRLFDNRLALDCWVIRPGIIRVGESARLVPTDQHPTHLGGWIVGAPYVNDT